MIIKYNYRIVLLLSVFITIYSFANPQKISAQEKIEFEVEAASKLLVKDYSLALSEFNKIGPKAISYIVKILFDDSNQTVFQKFRINPLLLNVIGQYQSNAADNALIKLLTHSRSLIRGDAAFLLGKRKVQRAIPELVSLLNDEDTYLIESSSGGSEKKILVRDVIVQALEKITETLLLPEKDYKAKSEAWLKWWQTNKTKCQ